MDVHNVYDDEKTVHVRTYLRYQPNGCATIEAHWRRPRGTLVKGSRRYRKLEKGHNTLS
jgi:hypothetical protein